jgi:hypothetical protein
MTLGPGRYDDLATLVRECSGMGDGRGGVVVIVVGGNRGNGFSVQADEATILLMADLLEMAAKQMREDMS